MATELVATPSEGTHWYDRDGNPHHTIVGANGVERNTTLRDARKHGWLPSVTTIIQCAARYGLERWKAKQLLLSGLTMPRTDGESEDEWEARVWEDSKAQAKKAAERGTEIHGAIEAFYGDGYLGGVPAVDTPHGPWIHSIDRLIHQEFGEQSWRPEKSFASPLGFGGKIDLHSDSVLLDFKGKEAKNGIRDWRTYDEHAMQLAAYCKGLGWIEQPWTAGIIFFDRNEPYSELHVVKPAELERGWEMFRALLAYWKAANRYE